MLARLPLAVFSIVAFGWFLAHLTLLATAGAGLGPVIVVVLLTQFNDACAFLVGKRFGRLHWSRLSPNKTVAGSLGALAITCALALLNWPIAYPSLPWWGALGFGVVISLGGQAGDLLMATFKREVGIKDWGDWLPGHGGILDRANSLILVAPLVTQLGQIGFGLFPNGIGGPG
jgi:phosphatidate cytidylyltransferase